ncbi:hypothetical protein EVAR_93932_1 [Eumeta japonica]|uniref:Uncharacterized protein n=1 Tax=Eumeta variegata TaxID=151549 RepID=A0A4C1TP53_EUMVA|nr:hypothetical protein EVAR_93932_1 [Eumeta japonica]
MMRVVSRYLYLQDTITYCNCVQQPGASTSVARTVPFMRVRDTRISSSSIKGKEKKAPLQRAAVRRAFYAEDTNLFAVVGAAGCCESGYMKFALAIRVLLG